MLRTPGFLTALLVLWVVTLVVAVCLVFMFVEMSSMRGGGCDVGVVPDTVPHWVRGDTLVVSDEPSFCVL